MNGAALASLVGVGLRTNLRRLRTWIFAAVFLGIVCLLYWTKGLSFGGMTSTGVKLAMNSDYAIAAMLGAFSFYLMHFTATMCGDGVVEDIRLRAAPLIQATPVDRRTYLLGRFLGGWLSLLAIYAIYLAALVLGQLVPPHEDKLTLAFRLAPYLRHALWFVLIPTFFVGAVSFAIGTLTGSMKVVYAVVTALMVAWFLVINALADTHLRHLAYVEPSGMAWIAEKIAKSRGNAWLNEHAILPGSDLLFVLNRLALAAIGAGALGWTLLRYRGEEPAAEPAASSLLARAWRWLRGARPPIADAYAVWSSQTAVPQVEPAPRGLRLALAQLASSTATELRLLGAERSLWIMVPMIMILCGLSAKSFAGPFQVRVYPVSSEFAQQMVPMLLLLLAGTTIFYTGEVFHRDDASGVRPIVYASPVGNGALLLGKLAAMILLSVGMVLLAVATGVVWQLVAWRGIDGRFYLDLEPYARIFGRVLLPSVVVLCSLALAINVLLRGRLLAYFACIALGGVYLLWLLPTGRRSLLDNPLLLGHWTYSDLTKLEPYAEPLRLHHLYWGSIVAALLLASCWLLERTEGPLRRLLSPAHLASRPAPVLGSAAFLACALAAGLQIERRGNVRGTEEAIERAQLEMEDRYLAELEKPHLAYEKLDLDVRLWPERGTLDVEGTIELVNPFPEPVERALFTVDPLYAIRRFELDGQSGPHRLDRWILEVPLAQPVQPGERRTLRLDWSGAPRPGFDEDGGPQNTFLHRSATFLSSFQPEIVPLPGVSALVFLTDGEERADHGRGKLSLLRDRSRDPFVPSFFGIERPFDLTARIEAPAGQSVLCGGVLEGRETLGERARHTFKSAHPLRSFAILAADYGIERRGADEVHFHPAHRYNLATILRALEDARADFALHFGPYPHELLRIAEFPRVAGFAQSYPTLMPYSESIGFLTHHGADRRRIDATYFVTAHEVAHQWWGYIASPGLSLGAQVLLESLAEYSGLVLIDARAGEDARLAFLEHEEDVYLRARDPDQEVPLLALGLEGAEVRYQKGGHVFYMLERQIGRERLLAGLRSFVARWRDLSEQGAAGGTLGPRHPTLPDLLDELRQQHRGEDLEWFYRQWFAEVTVPDMAFEGEAEVRADGGVWSVDFAATNLGTGRLPVQVVAVKGEWRSGERLRKLAAGKAVPLELSAPITLWLEPGRTVRAMVTATFEPEALLIDRLYECLDFDRTNNATLLEPPQQVSRGKGARPSSSAPARN